MVLRTDGRTFAVSQAAPDFLILSEPNRIPPGEAELIVQVDGETSKFHFVIAHRVDGRRAELRDSIDTEPARKELIC